MSTLIKFELKELRRLANDKQSCVIEKRVVQNLALRPWCLGNLKEAIKNLLDYKIGKFDKEFDGILLSYKNLRVLQNIGAIRNDSAEIHFQIQADFFIFKPHVGATLRGNINKKSITHLSALVHRVFNVVIPRPTEEPGNKWIGVRVQEGQEVTFRIVVLDLFGALPYIRGELDESSLQFGDGDDEMAPKQIEPVIVTYVNFNKTKPSTQQRQCGDGLPQSNTVQNNQSEENESNRNSTNPKPKILDKYDIKKIKRSSKVQVDEAAQAKKNKKIRLSK